MDALHNWIPLFSALTGAGGAIIAAWVSIKVQRKKLSQDIALEREKLNEEIQIQRDRLATEFATEVSVESALKHFLEIYELPYRSFPMIKHHIGGFDPNELRRLLVRTGAVRFMAADGTEIWALRERVPDAFRLSRWKHENSPMNKVSENELFPGAYNDPSQY